MLFALRCCRVRLQCSSESLSARFGFGRRAMRAQAWSICSSRLPWADIRAVALGLPVALFGSAAVSVRGAPGFPGFGLSALVLAVRSSRVPSRLTVRSSRRRISASLKLAAVRAILAPHCRGRRGLTQALGGRKTFCGFVARKPGFIGFGWQCSSDGLSARYWLRSLCGARSCMVNSFFTASVGRHSRRLVKAFSRSVRHFDCACAGRARFSSLRLFGNGVGVVLFSGSHAPNNSFKPTPHRGVGHVPALR
jgi:hypothetical protein